MLLVYNARTKLQNSISNTLFFVISNNKWPVTPRKLFSLVVTDVFLNDLDFVLILLFESLELKLFTRCFQNDLVCENDLSWAVNSSKVLPSDFRYSEKRENSELQRIIEEGSEGGSSKSSLEGLQLRFLTPYDIEEVRLLCTESFPIEYPMSWWVEGNCAKSQLFNANDIDSFRYEDITSNSTRFYSLAAIYNCAIVGLIVAEIKSWAKLNKEDRTILSESLGRSSSLAYILSLGVHQKYFTNSSNHCRLNIIKISCRYRRNGIATILLQNFIGHLQGSEQNSKIKAIYLHVLTTNQPAIVFYERHKWVRRQVRGA